MRPVYFSFFVCLSAATLAAQQPVANRTAYDHERDAPQATATRLAGSISIDGSLKEAAWQTAKAVTQFTQLDPSEGKPASERTEIRFLYDNDALYVGAMMYDRQKPRGR